MGISKNISPFGGIVVSLVKNLDYCAGWEHICWIYESKIYKSNSSLSQDQVRESTHNVMILCEKTSYHLQGGSNL